MIHEYALEPELVATWTDRQVGRYFIEKFGLGQPRIVSRYPKRWKRLAWAALQTANEIERKRMEELLARLGGTMVKRPDARWDPEEGWLDNAVDEHVRAPFHAILARTNPHAENHVLVAQELDDTTHLWEKPRGLCVSRSAADLAAAVAALLRSAREIVFVDPHFGPENVRYRESLRAFLRAVLDNRPGALPDRVEVQCSADGGATESFFQEECERRLPRIVPRGLRVDLIRLSRRGGGERLHNRYILTDIGSVTFGAGIDRGDASDSDDIELLDRVQHEKRWAQYAGKTPAFDRPERPVTIVGQ